LRRALTFIYLIVLRRNAKACSPLIKFHNRKSYSPVLYLKAFLILIIFANYNIKSRKCNIRGEKESLDPGIQIKAFESESSLRNELPRYVLKFPVCVECFFMKCFRHVFPERRKFRGRPANWAKLIAQKTHKISLI
jgi:hypothetical protein